MPEIKLQCSRELAAPDCGSECWLALHSLSFRRSIPNILTVTPRTPHSADVLFRSQLAYGAIVSIFINKSSVVLVNFLFNFYVKFNSVNSLVLFVSEYFSV